MWCCTIPERPEGDVTGILSTFPFERRTWYDEARLREEGGFRRESRRRAMGGSRWRGGEGSARRRGHDTVTQVEHHDKE